MKLKILDESTNPKKNKVFVFTCVILLVVILYSACYMLFFRTISIDVTSDIAIDYKGENGSGSVEVTYGKENANSRLNEFLNTLSYSISPNENLTNGDNVDISVSYDKAIAQAYRINVINANKAITIDNLPIRYQDVSELDPAYVTNVYVKGEKYLDKMMDSILSRDFSSFVVNEKATLIDKKQVYQIFLHGAETSTNDKIMLVYELKASGNILLSDNTVQKQEQTIYYAITFNKVNNANLIEDEDIYGEKLILSNDLKLDNEAALISFIQNLYKDNQSIQLIKK